MMRLFAIIQILLIGIMASGEPDKDEKVLDLPTFIKLATENDPAFQAILIDRLYIRYNKALTLPASDLVCEVAGQYDFVLDNESNADGDTEGSVSISRLFPATGTKVSAGYEAVRSSVSSNNSINSSFTAQITQSIVRNAFGRTTRMLEEKVELANELARHQIIEAHEDYLAALMTVYMNWYAASENLKSAQEVLKYDQALLSEIKRKRRYRIALPEDIGKVTLEVLSAREQLMELEESYDNYTSEIKKCAGLDDRIVPVPSRPVRDNVVLPDENAQKLLIEESRTVKMLKLLESQGLIAVRIAEDDLLPSAELFAGYETTGSDYNLKEPEHLVYGGFNSTLNFGKQIESATHEKAKIDQRKTLYQNRSSLLTLKTDIENLKKSIIREREMISLYQDRLRLVMQVLDAERKNYRIGKASLNDLIDIMNTSASTRYKAIYHEVRLKQLIVEWQRLTDSLVVPGRSITR